MISRSEAAENTFWASVQMPPDMKISEWADENRVLSSESSALPGRWRTDFAPFQGEMMDVIKDPDIHTVVIQSCAQIGKTEMLLNDFGYFADHEPSPMMVVQPTIDMGMAFAKDRIEPMRRDCKALSDIIAEAGSSGNTIMHKAFPGGHLTVCGANSPSALASRPIRILFLDEVDRFPASAGSEGDPVKLAIKRTASFVNRKIIMTSTPTVKGGSRIELAFESSDQRRYHIPCPECGNMDHIKWSNIHWAKDEDNHWDRSAPWLECEACKAVIPETSKRSMIVAGRWIAGAESHGVAGFHINEMYSPTRTWTEIVEDHYEAMGDTELRRVWVNTTLGETYEEQGKTIDAHWLYSRREVYNAEVPMGGLVLVASVDVQDNRLECQVRAFGKGLESWRVAYRILHGSPADDSVWEQLDEIILDGQFYHESGAIMGVSSTCIDSAGHHTQRVYEYCKARAGQKIYPIVGRGGFGKPLVSAPSSKKRGRDYQKMPVYTLGVDELKQSEYTRLEIAEPGPGYCHFPATDEFSESYFEQLTSEEIYMRMVMGIPKPSWRLKRGHRRNEALDCSGYDYAALVLLRPNMDALEQALTGKSKAAPVKAPSLLESRRAARSPRQSGGFANSWRK